MDNGSDSPDTAPTLMHHLGTNEIGRSYTSYELGPDLAPALKKQRMLREVSKEDVLLKIPVIAVSRRTIRHAARTTTATTTQ
jgi:hypothetical protein